MTSKKYEPTALRFDPPDLVAVVNFDGLTYCAQHADRCDREHPRTVVVLGSDTWAADVGRCHVCKCPILPDADLLDDEERFSSRAARTYVPTSPKRLQRRRGQEATEHRRQIRKTTGRFNDWRGAAIRRSNEGRSPDEHERTAWKRARSWGTT